MCEWENILTVTQTWKKTQFQIFQSDWAYEGEDECLTRLTDSNRVFSRGTTKKFFARWAPNNDTS